MKKRECCYTLNVPQEYEALSDWIIKSLIEYGLVCRSLFLRDASLKLSMSGEVNATSRHQRIWRFWASKKVLFGTSKKVD